MKLECDLMKGVMMGDPNDGQWNGQPNRQDQSGQQGQPRYGAYDSNHGGQFPTQGAQGPQGGPGQNPYYGPYAYNPGYGPNGQPYQADEQRNDQDQSGWQQTNWYTGNFNPFRLIEEWLPEKAKTKIRVIYGVVGVAAIALGAALLLVPNKTLALAALLLGVYFVISGVVRIVGALVEPFLPAGWRVLDVFVGILLTFGGVVVVRNYGMTGQTLALLITMMVGFGWIMDGGIVAYPSFGMGHRLCDYLDCCRLYRADESAELCGLHGGVWRMRHGRHGYHRGYPRFHFRQAQKVDTKSSSQSVRAGSILARALFLGRTRCRRLAVPGAGS